MRRSVFVAVCVLLAVVCSLPQTAPAQRVELLPPPKGKQYELRLLRVGKAIQGIRFHIVTGETWTVEDDKYTKLAETDPIPAGDYDVTLVTDDNNWMAFRIDRLTGATWQLRGNKWVRVKESGDK
jgi:hypothetical protein